MAQVLVISGGVPVSNASPFSVLARIPHEADESNGQLSILNVHTTATMYFKWVPIEQTGQVFETADAGVVLTATRGYSWDRVPPGKMLIGRSTVDGAICAVDGVIALKPFGRR